uniref:Uncharacterized protein n=1 Tax=Seriola lalandi dorsalis TaxID=1841481 RepID=A0A3B4X8Q3_SERLL
MCFSSSHLLPQFKPVCTVGSSPQQLRVSVDCVEKGSSNLSIGIDFAYPFR